MIINSIKLNKINFEAQTNKDCNKDIPAPNIAAETELPVLTLQNYDVAIQKMQTQAETEIFLNRSSRLSKEEYDDIIRNHPDILLQANLLCQKYKGQIKPVDMAKTAIKASEYLNKNYKNHRIISIGTSPAALCEQLSLLGHDVVFVPISGMSKYRSGEQTLDDLPDLKTVLEYLKSKNIKDGKLNIVIDYISTGRTLDNFCQCIEKYCNLNWDDYVSMSMQHLLDKALGKNKTHEFEYIKYKFKTDMTNSDIENIANVPHFCVVPSMYEKYNKIPYTISSKNKTQDELNFEFDDFSKPLARAYSLCTFDEIQKLK